MTVKTLMLTLLVAVVQLVLFGAFPAFAAAPAPDLTIHSLATPTHFSSTDTEECLNERFGPRPCDGYQVTVTNSGALPAKGPIVLTDELPAVRSGGVRFSLAKNQVVQESEATEGEPVKEPEEGVCTLEAARVSCEFLGKLLPDRRLEMRIDTTVEEGAVSAPNTASVSEEGKQVASTSEDDVIESTAPLFGPSAFLSDIASSDGAPDTQAGDHPYEFVTRIDTNTEMGTKPDDEFGVTPVGRGLRDVVVDLPLGFLGSATSTPKCTLAQLQSLPASCARDTVVGHLTVETSAVPELTNVNSSIYNMVPEAGVAAEFGFRDDASTAHLIVASVVPTPQGYVLRATARELPHTPLIDVITTLYGDPAAKNGAGATPAALFTNSSDCSGQPLATTLHMDSWEHPGSFNPDGTPNLSDKTNWTQAVSKSPPVTRCNALRFSPEAFSVQPDTSAADSPTGLTFDLKLPQSEQPETLATPPLRNATVTLPAGMTVNPAFAGGLDACSEAQIGWLGGSLTNFTPDAPTCPEASRIGDLGLTTPLIEGTLHGSIYLAKQNENPFGTLLAGYIVVDDPTTGTIVKIPGELRTNPETGQITGVFKENPQLPFSELKLRFFGGPKGELATPQSCGVFTPTSLLEPWSHDEAGGEPTGTPDATPSSSFPITSNCSGAFAPSFQAGTQSNQAGAFSPLSVTLSRNDGEQHFSGLTVTTPPGVSGVLAGIPLCGEPQASKGECGSGSQIGEATVAAGVGPLPYWVHGGRVYLTGPYNGGPFGLSIVVPAVAGPFNLGNVVVRASIRVDPHTAQITVVSDPFPQMINSIEGLRSGIPADLRTVNVTINRQGFTFNPTSCEHLLVSGTVSGAQGATAAVSSAFQAANCGHLNFSPKFAVSTSGKTSKANGASLTVKVAQKPGEADIHKVDLTLPLALPSRLTTLQKACTSAQFEANPAGCPAASVVGAATAHTPVLQTPLTGPAYLVSHGGAAFPDLEFVLQADERGGNVEIVLDGGTDIKKGITYSKFETVPDAPISSFETVLPEGPHSALAANGNLCLQKLVMPTSLTGQNGAVLNQNTTISAEGCPNSLSVSLKRVRGRTLTLGVWVPAAGRLTARGKGLSKASETSGGREELKLTLHAKKAGRFTARLRLSFTPKRGRTLAKTVRVSFHR